ncbi:MAG: membrane integrity-associated transporter subunit PqiC [Ectothiorhodospiraceae bacterium]|nr:membrane integrity-associated transporter subunit PqiC [Ectothiorhodospiraceae bacterium]MCH8506976.1 ABC-type transport auxiliary lipoprotein family protein [Ectothiorhodospiraceae bacterium]
MRLPALLVSAVTVLLLSGCMALNAPDTHQQTWQLVAPEFGEPSAAGPSTDGVLLVARVQASPAYDSSAMAYRETDYEIRYFAYNRWAERPARQLQPILVDAFEQAGLFHAVLASPASLPSNYRLETELLHLEHDQRSSPGQARLGLRWRLIDLSAQEVLLSGSRRFGTDMAEANASAFTSAANQALKEAIREIVSEVRAALSD